MLHNSYVPNPNELRYAHTLTTSNVTRPIRLVSGHNIRKRPIVRNVIHLAGHIANCTSLSRSSRTCYSIDIFSAKMREWWNPLGNTTLPSRSLSSFSSVCANNAFPITWRFSRNKAPQFFPYERLRRRNRRVATSVKSTQRYVMRYGSNPE